tara:strand:- start:868 stop:1506 length:639 start_codon:yes stop_codon:yes gene_type:complete
MSLKVKICGINSKESFLASKNADYIGFVFFPKSPRFINAEAAKELSSLRAKNQSIVGLFVNTEEKVIEYISEYVDLDYIQLHGQESIGQIKSIKSKTKRPVIKALSVSSEKDVENHKKYLKICDMLLFDTMPTENDLPGGNGKNFNWKILENFNSRSDWMLAGGININNVKQAVDITKAPIVDLSSALEISKGLKCPKKIKKFLNYAKFNRI